MKWASVMTELKSFSGKERIFIFCAMLCGFLISADYSIIRPVSNSVFITAYSASFFPYVWLATVPLNLCIVALYNKYLPRLGTYRTFLATALTIVSINLFAASYLTQLSWLPFLFFTWKEVYIMLMLQQLWSVIHATIAFHRAKYLYGILFSVGALGSAFGSSVPSFLAVKVGSEQLLFASLPLYLLLMVCFKFLIQHSSADVARPIEEEKKSSFNALKHGMQLIAQSKFLTLILFIVIFMQVSSTLIDYQFNHYLEKAVPLKDLRTQYTARIFGIVHLSTIALQLFGSFLLVHFLGIRRSHFLIPLILCANGIAFLFFPIFSMISLSFITIKCFDFSLFSVIKEMLYIPLKKDEKFRAKAVIDVFAHRTSKALASFLILGLQFFLGRELSMSLSYLGIALFISWCFIVHLMLREYPGSVNLSQ